MTIAKDLRNLIFTTISLMLLFYLMGAFIEWDINPGNWAEGARFIIAIIGVLVSVFLGGVVYTETRS